MTRTAGSAAERARQGRPVRRSCRMAFEPVVEAGASKAYGGQGQRPADPTLGVAEELKRN